jgi:carbamate kinase
MAATGKKNGKTVVVALGGNAILQPGQVGTFEEQLFNIDGAMRRIAQLVEDGWEVVLTHGNGPQVGNLLIQNALAAKTVAPMPMDVCGAESQGQIGYMAAQTLANHLKKRRLGVPVVTIVTQVAVDPKDKAFASPSKPVGPFYSEGQARRMMLEEGTAMREDAGRGWRRVVASPHPLKVVQREMIRDAALAGHIVVAAGGGGIPIHVLDNNDYEGIECVLDKDLTSAVLASQIGAELLIILTAVPKVYLNYGKPEQLPLGAVTLDEIEQHIAAGHFPPGSMGPKMEAIHDFLQRGGKRGLITDPAHLRDALDGKAGTHFVGRI